LTDPAVPRDPRCGMGNLFGDDVSGHILARWLF
jgi:hypothetical protein